MKHINLRTLVSVTAAAALTLATASPALAQSAEGGASSQLVGDAVVGSSQNPASSGSSLDATLSSLSLIGSSEIPLGGPLLSSNENYPLAKNPRPTSTAQLISTEDISAGVIPADGRLQRWTVYSPSMQRDVSVQIMHSADRNAPAPLLYLLDGIDAPYNSGWLGPGNADEFFRDKNVTLVMPTQAPGSWYSDWEQEDPALGLNKWETFITKELDPLLTSSPGLNFNNRRGIGGLSMGASGAVHLANTTGDMFHGVFGISGCYSPTDPMGRQIVNIVTGSRGGDVENMWGPFGSEEWQRHDVVADPENLRDKAVYLSAANGEITDADRAFYGEDVVNMTAGTVLERGVLSCTEDLDAAMRDRGMNRHVVDYKGAGVHAWSNFREQLEPAWDTIKDSLK